MGFLNEITTVGTPPNELEGVQLQLYATFLSGVPSNFYFSGGMHGYEPNQKAPQISRLKKNSKLRRVGPPFFGIRTGPENEFLDMNEIVGEFRFNRCGLTISRTVKILS